MSNQTVRSPIKAMVWKIEVEIGQPVGEYDPLLILESMKTEIPVEAPASGIVREILVKAGDSVEEDQPLFVVGPAA
ncbi:MAG: acetyl-CoA carboxylase biotin carboxyl carrier protein subunit [Mesorhizobium sp.]